MTIGSTDQAMLDLARGRIEGLTRELVVGDIITGKVSRLTNFGAFVELIPGKDGLLRSEEMGEVETDIDIGQEITVMIQEIDNLGRLNLSRRALFGDEGQPVQPRPAPRPAPYGGDRRGGPGGPRPGGPGGPRPGGGGGFGNRSGGPGGPQAGRRSRRSPAGSRRQPARPRRPRRSPAGSRRQPARPRRPSAGSGRRPPGTAVPRRQRSRPAAQRPLGFPERPPALPE